MVTAQTDPPTLPRRGLIVGNYCHDVLTRNGTVVAETLGGAASFVSTIFDGLSIPCDLVSKVGGDFAYSTNHAPIAIPTSKTTLFHAHFDSNNGHGDRILKRVCACDPIRPSDLPDARYDLGMAVGVGGEILPETLEKMVDICNVVFVDVQALIRAFDGVDGTVRLVGLKESGFSHLLHRIGFLKASTEEALLMDVDEVRKLCCVVETSGKEGCKVFWNEGEMKIAAFVAKEVDPTGAGDSFLAAFAAALFHGLPVPDAALLGNFYGSLTVAQIGIPKFDSTLLKRVKDEVQRRRRQITDGRMDFKKAAGHDQLYASLVASKLLAMCAVQENHYAVKPSLIHSAVYEEAIKTVDAKP